MTKPIQILPETQALLKQTSVFLEPFLESWTQYSAEIGHGIYTTSKRADCILSLEWYIEGILSVLGKEKSLPSLADLINNPQWAENLLGTAHRHHIRGVTLPMYCGNFKTFLYALENAISQTHAATGCKKQALTCIRRFADAYETLVIEQWANSSQQQNVDLLAESNRELTLEKSKYQNILTSISDLVFVLDQQGKIIELNQSAQNFLTGQPLLGTYIWNHFPINADNMSMLLKNYVCKQRHSLKNDKNSHHFDMMLVPLHEVSLVSNTFLAVFTDVSAHIQQQSVLEALVSKRTDDLEKEKQHLEEMNITLKNVLRSIEQQKDETVHEHVTVLKEKILPTLHRLKLEKSQQSRDVYLEILETQLKRIYDDISPQEQVFLSNDLSPVEQRICHMLSDGVSSKNIAQAMNLSLETIHTHRKNIRKKLGLIGKNISIFNYLNGLSAN